MERVEDHAGRGVAYKYQGELLKETTLPDGTAFRYGYTPQENWSRWRIQGES